MLKRIPVSDLRLGMYIHEFCGSWMEHPFWRTNFRLDSPGDLTQLRESSIQEVWIDTDRGLDVASGEPLHAAQARVDATLEAAADVVAPASGVERTTLARELARAEKICARGRQAVTSMFHETRMGKALDAIQAEPLVEEISHSVARNPGAFISLARLKTKDDYTYMHSMAVCALMVALARQLGLSEADTRAAGMAGLLHDLGKAMIPLDILNKPGKLTDGEFAIIKTHPTEGHRLLLEGRGVGEIPLDVVRHHHEKMDGSGYPDGLAGDAISLFARMGAVCDVYDAITSNRPYKAGWDPAESLRRMAEWAQGHFDPHIFQAFVKSIGIYPIGSLVRLESHRLGVVVDQGEKSLLTPRVRVFFSTRARTYIKPELIDLGHTGCHDKIVAREDAARWGIRNVDALWREAAAA